MAINLPESIDSNYSSPLSRPFTDYPLPIYHPSLHNWKGGWLWKKWVTVTNQQSLLHAAPHVWRELYTALTKFFHLSPLNAFLLSFAIRATKALYSYTRTHLTKGHLNMVYIFISHIYLSQTSTPRLSPRLQELEWRTFPSTISQYRQLIRNKCSLKCSITIGYTMERCTVPKPHGLGWAKISKPRVLAVKQVFVWLPCKPHRLGDAPQRIINTWPSLRLTSLGSMLSQHKYISSSSWTATL